MTPAISLDGGRPAPSVHARVQHPGAPLVDTDASKNADLRTAYLAQGALLKAHAQTIRTLKTVCALLVTAFGIALIAAGCWANEAMRLAGVK